MMALFFTLLKKKRELISFASKYYYKAYLEGRNAKTKSSGADFSHVSVFYFCNSERGTIWRFSKHAYGGKPRLRRRF
ncbi:hypothetical protein THF1C08_470004 [Vibrio jasicida]|uniref:Uncharacterized protein n=1 Tax=Vibrio jasicida TaxID=766224 RepID=A0AAU9QST9_9VIBR|nr:hypothetical protein THF1C08_470004 [Vibrio jasicida]CAH1601242.1 hypothetical protein THF1A12_480004 [Vibrio jasicida]